MSRKRITMGLSAYALDKIVVTIVQIATVPIFAKTWGLSLYGIWVIMMTIPSFLNLSDFGIVSSAAARMSAFVSRQQWNEARGTLHTAWSATLTIVAVAIVGIGLAVWLVPTSAIPTAPHLQSTESRLTILILLSYGLANIVFRLNTAAYRASLRYTFASLCNTGSYFCENAVAIGLVLAGCDPLGVATGMLLVRLGWIVLLLVASRSLLPDLRPGFSAASWREWSMMWRPALAASALSFGLVGYLQGSVMVLGAVAGAAVVPAFVAVRTLSRLGVQMSTLISIPVMQEFAHAMGRDDEYRGGRYFGLVTLPACAMAAGVCIGFVCLGAIFVKYWSAGVIVASQELITYMAISSFAAMFWNPVSNLIQSVNRQHSFSFANVAASVVGLLLIWFAAPLMGAAAAGLSFALVDVVTFAAVAHFTWKHWLSKPEFRRGMSATVRELRSPLSMLKSIKGVA